MITPNHKAPLTFAAIPADEGLRKALQKTRADLIAEITASQLKGRGGAGFPTGVKWNLAAAASGEQKFVVCNADEGEPGTFKDRVILSEHADLVFEGMTIGGYAIGASRGILYLRGEYTYLRDHLEGVLAERRKKGLLGKDVGGKSGFAFDIEIRMGSGAYVCGEETALIESLEGKRGNPRLKPPYPVTHGLWQKPTLVNNVETLSNVPEIIYRGSPWFRGFGTDKCPGTKVFTILGHVEYPGLIEVEMGTPLREIIFSFGGGVKGGKNFKAALLGGAAGVFLSEKLLDVPMDFESLKENKAVLGSGAVLVMNEDTSIVEMLFSILKFFAHESCGQCAPCRIGTRQLLDFIYRIREGKGAAGDLDRMVNLSKTMFATSLCPLGQSLLMPVKSAIDFFRDDFLKNINPS